MANIKGIVDFVNESKVQSREGYSYITINFYGKSDLEKKFLEVFKKWKKGKGYNYETWVKNENIGKVMVKIKEIGFKEPLMIYP